MLFNQKYWGRLAQKQWLTARDQSSLYFHQTTTVRKRRMYISYIKNEVGNWIEDIEVIKDKFV